MDRTSEFNKKDIEENKGIAAFAYFGFSFIMPLWGAADSPFARFHANQGMVLAFNELILCIFMVLSHIFAVSLNNDFFRYTRLILCVVLICAIIFYSIRGKAKELPLIGNIKLIR